jgi:CHAT domain-containing protein
VLKSIAGSDIIHFACHGSSDSTKPSDSHLLLRKSSASGPVVDRLTVSDISKVETLGRARVAYLSACSTAEVKATRLADESLHIAGAFQVAGFAHVIGSLRPVDDDASIRVAKHLYEELSSTGKVQHPTQAVAAALRSAVLQLRSESPYDPSLWAAYIHSGA